LRARAGVLTHLLEERDRLGHDRAQRALGVQAEDGGVGGQVCGVGYIPRPDHTVPRRLERAERHAVGRARGPPRERRLRAHLEHNLKVEERREGRGRVEEKKALDEEPRVRAPRRRCRYGPRRGVKVDRGRVLPRRIKLAARLKAALLVEVVEAEHARRVAAVVCVQPRRQRRLARARRARDADDLDHTPAGGGGARVR
jgi:hypothetical protein